jgi:hypothetical protein
MLVLMQSSTTICGGLANSLDSERAEFSCGGGRTQATFWPFGRSAGISRLTGLSTYSIVTAPKPA